MKSVASTFAALIFNANRKMKKIVRAVSLMLLLTGFSGNAVADERGANPRDGAIHGRVIDNEKQTLPGLPSLSKI